MTNYFESLEQFQNKGGLKLSTITAKQLLPAMVMHMKRGDRQFSLYLNGRLPKPLGELLQEAFQLLHLQLPFYTQHCARQESSYKNISKSKIKIDFVMKYRMSREEQSWVLQEIQSILAQIIKPQMSDLQKIIAVHDYIVRNHYYEMNTTGSPFTVYTFMHEKQGVCMAYALLFEKMMSELQIPCLYVIGDAEGESDLGHGWNMVQLNGEWYHIDSTWNDIGSKLKNHEIRYRYFLRSDDFMKKDHYWNSAHYPQCLSETYKGLSNVYDVTYTADHLYFPHPKSAFLVEMEAQTRKTKIIVNERVQFCTEFENAVYFSHVDQQWALYKYNCETQEIICVDERKVLSIKRLLNKMSIQFNEGEPLELELASILKIKPTIKAKEVDLSGFGSSWFGSYKGKAEPIRFICEDGMELLFQDAHKQISVDLLLTNQLEISITTDKKPLNAEKPVEIKFPKQIAKQLGLESIEIKKDTILESRE